MNDRSNAVSPFVDRTVDGIKNRLMDALPATVDVADLKRVFALACHNNPDLMRSDQGHLRMELLKCAADGLLPDGRLAAFVKFKSKYVYMPMYTGILQRLRELGELFSLSVQLVYEHDEIEYLEGSETTIIHRPKVFAREQNRGAIVGGYCVFRDREKRVLHVETMSMAELEDVAKMSPAKNGPWNGPFRNEMYRKTLIRRASKFVSMSRDARQLIERDDQLIELTPVGKPHSELTDQSSSPLAEAAAAKDRVSKKAGPEVSDPPADEDGVISEVNQADLDKAWDAGADAGQVADKRKAPKDYSPEQCKEWFKAYDANFDPASPIDREKAEDVEDGADGE